MQAPTGLNFCLRSDVANVCSALQEHRDGDGDCDARSHCTGIGMRYSRIIFRTLSDYRQVSEVEQSQHSRSHNCAIGCEIVVALNPHLERGAMGVDEEVFAHQHLGPVRSQWRQNGSLYAPTPGTSQLTMEAKWVARMQHET